MSGLLYCQWISRNWLILEDSEHSYWIKKLKLSISSIVGRPTGSFTCKMFLPQPVLLYRVVMTFILIDCNFALHWYNADTQEMSDIATEMILTGAGINFLLLTEGDNQPVRHNEI